METMSARTVAERVGNLLFAGVMLGTSISWILVLLTPTAEQLGYALLWSVAAVAMILITGVLTYGDR